MREPAGEGIGGRRAVLSEGESAMDQNTTRSSCRNCDEARQGVTGHHVREVLGWGVIATILAFAAVAISA